MRSLGSLAASDYPFRRVCLEHRRVLDTQPEDNKPLTHAGYPGHRRVRRVLGEGMREDTRGRVGGGG
jgi:hypothetical protein